MKLIPILAKDFDAIYDAMERAFVLEERRDREPARALLDNGLYTVYHVEEDGERVGFVAIWTLGEWSFIEHFVIYEPYRNRGLGAKALLEMKALFSRIVLEVERPVTELAARRIAFYLRCGFTQNDYPYRQPSYRGAGGEVEMYLMTYPSAPDDCRAVAKMLYDRVYGVALEEYQ